MYMFFCVRVCVCDQVLRRPGSPADARSIPAAIVARDMPVWNTTLVILRELCFTDQDLSERLGGEQPPYGREVFFFHIYFMLLRSMHDTTVVVHSPVCHATFFSIQGVRACISYVP